MSIVGGDLAQMEQLARKITEAQGQVESLISFVTNAVASTTWEGPAALRFRDQWDAFSNNELRAKLNGEILEAFKGEVNARAEQIRIATG
jgi:uncharacterized protein YukE